MNPTTSRVLLVLTALSCNLWSIGWWLTDGRIESKDNQLQIAVFQGFLVLAALLVPRLLVTRPALLRGLTIFALPVLFLGIWGSVRATGLIRTATEKQIVSDLDFIQRNETVHLGLSPKFKRVAKGLANLGWNRAPAATIFADSMLIRGLEEKGHAELLNANLGLVHTDWELEAAAQDRDPLAFDPFAPFFADVDYLDHAKAFFLKGRLEGEGDLAWRADAGVSLLARMQDGSWQQAGADLELLWERPADTKMTEMDAWQLTQFLVRDFHTIAMPKILYSEELAAAVDDPTDVAEAHRSRPMEEVVKMVLEADTWQKPYPYFTPHGAEVNEAVSVVDYDGDGLDDFYFCADLGRNLMFHNLGNGKFEEVSEKVGLAIDGFSGVALFADFDNDGDPDLFLGRNHRPSRFFRNDGGSFQDAPEWLPESEGPKLVANACAADVDGDGLLDLYLGTYVGPTIAQERFRPGRTPDAYFEDHLPMDLAKEFYRRDQESESTVFDRAGPPNHFWKNTGQGFVSVQDSPTLVWRNTYQASFSDFDQDGDPDLYLAQDYAPNNFFRNDEGRFVEITKETASADVGFGMGISWGDYDEDGDQDLYVSNMFSKAGRRITALFSSVDARLPMMARGNSMLRLDSGSYERVSSLDESGVRVEWAGWSWGSMFLDADQDGALDVHSLSGYYTAPKVLESDEDL